MKKFIFVMIVTLGFQVTSAQQFQINCFLNDVCYPSSANITVQSPQAGYTYQWYLANSNNPCQAVQPVQVGTGTGFNASISGQYYCMGFSATGSIASNSIYARILPASGPNHAPAPGLYTGNMSCVTSAYLCVPIILWQQLPLVLSPITVTWYRNNIQIPGTSGGNYTATQTGYYKYSLSGSCISYSDSTYVSILPVANVIAGGSTTICPGENVTLNVNTVDGTTYQWKNDTVNINGATSTSYQAIAAGKYSCVATNGCGSITSNIVTVTQLQNPPSGISTNGPLTFCQGLAFSADADTGSGLTYQWKKNNVNINGANASSYSVKASGSYTCEISNACGTNTSNPLVFTVINAPGASVTANGPTTFCQGGSVLLNTTTGPNRTYQWLKNGIYISGATLSSYTATTAGTYKVNVYNTSTGCSKKTTTGTVITIATPAATITPQGPTSFCAGSNVVLQANTGAGLSYAWKRNGVFIPGATLSNLTVTTAGTYKVQVTNSTACTKLSAGIVVSVSCREDETNLQDANKMSIFPDPSYDKIFVQLNGIADNKMNWILADVEGKIIWKKIFSEKSVELDVSALNQGIYFLNITTADGQILHKKFVIQK